MVMIDRASTGFNCFRLFQCNRWYVIVRRCDQCTGDGLRGEVDIGRRGKVNFCSDHLLCLKASTQNNT